MAAGAGSETRDTETEKEHTLDEAVDLTGEGCYSWLVLGACSVVSNAAAVDIFGFSVVVTAATCDLRLSVIETALLASAPFAGTALSLPWGYYADVGGRRRALLVSTAGGATAAALSALAPSAYAMLALKLVCSLFSNAAFTLTIAYLGESVCEKRRSQYLFIMNSANLAAEIVFFGLAYFILPLNFIVAVPWLAITFRPWRLYTLLLAIPMGVGAVMMLFLQESPKFLANVGERDEALRILNAIYECNGGKKGEYPVKALQCENIRNSNKSSFWSSVSKQTVPLFRPPLLLRTVQLFYLMAICFSTNNVFLMWYPMMVNLFFNSIAKGGGGTVDDQSFCQRIASNISTSTYSVEQKCIDTISPNMIYSGIILGVVFVSLNLSAAAVARWRKLVLLTVYLLSGLCLILVNLVRDPIGNLIVFTLVQCSAIGIGCITGYMVDLYPTNYRGMVTSLGVMFGRFASIGGVNAVGAAIVQYCQYTFYFWAGLVACAIVVAAFLPPPASQNKAQKATEE